MTPSEEHQKKRHAERLGTCVHFTGIQHPTCAAGVKYADVRDSRINGPYRWPCLPPHDGSTCPTSCTKRQFPTEEQVAADEARLRERLGDTVTARRAIVAQLGEYLKGKSHGVAGQMPCPICHVGTLHYSRSGYNGHIHAACTTATCVRWME